MTRFYKIFLLCILTFNFSKGQINYSFSAAGGAYVANAAPTIIHAASVDDAISGVLPIGFTFQYGCVNYTQFKASSNGVMFLGATAVGSNPGNNLTSGTDRPIIAPLWDDIKTSTTGNVNYKLTGVVGSRILTVEWLNMLWAYTAANPVITFQVKLYEGTNRIQFIYQQNAAAIVVNGASIGLGGLITGDYYSLNNTSAAPVASKLIETTTIATKPANGQVYQWDPVLCVGVPAAGTASANPNMKCANYTTTLSLTGASTACGLTYQWQSGPTAAGPWTNIGVSSSTITANVTVTTFYHCIVSCGASNATSAAVTASLISSGPCGLCTTSITIPYSTTGQTTCGQGNDITSSNVTFLCGSNLYYGGEDVVYTFTPATTGQININVTSTGSSMGVTLYQNCPLSGGTCVGQAQSFSGNQSFCPSVTAGQSYYLILDSYPSPACNPYDLNITLTPTTVACNMAYVATSVPYSFDVFAGTLCPSTDDILFTNLVNFGFNFCYDGQPYTDGYIASNSAFVFDAVVCNPNVWQNQIAAPGISTGWSITLPAPSLVSGTSSTPQNAILAPWHDINPALGGIIRYATLGVAPNRRFVVSWENVPMFSCGTASPSIYHTSQVKLFETSNNIEIHVGQKKVCPGWNNGEAILGITNSTGTIYRPPVNMVAHNAVGGAGPYNQWTMTNTAYKWTTACASGICVVLPIGFKTFYGVRADKINHIYWETDVEENVKIFKVERSTDAQNFVEIGSIDPNNKPSKYSFDDRTATPGVINYYRIVSFEKTGERKTTNVISLGSVEGEVAVTNIFPNPVQNSFTMGIDSKITTTTSIIIYDPFGKAVKSFTKDVGTGVTPVTFYVDGLSAGVYILEITDSNGQVISQQKLIKLEN